MSTRRLAAVAVLAAVVGGMPSDVSASSGPAALCTTAPSAGTNVNTDCVNDGSTTFETTLAVNPTNPANIIGAAISGQMTTKGNRLAFTGTVRPHVSFDGGATWTTYAVEFNGYANTIDPSVTFDAAGTAYLAVAASGTTNNPDIVVTR